MSNIDLLNVPKNSKKKIIGVYKYSSCNVNSLVNALNLISVKYKLSSNFSELSDCYKIILPGVGNMKNITKENMLKIKKIVEQYILEGGFVYGICLGCQLLFDKSEESGNETMGIFKGNVEEIKHNYNLKLNVGYKKLDFENNNTQEKRVLKYFDGIDLNTKFYFLHRYYCNFSDEKIFSLNINVKKKKMPALFFKGNVLGTQFHPELSKKAGIDFLKNISEMPL